MADEPLGEPIVIRFDGLDADQHELELLSLSEALDGLARIIAAAGHFGVLQEVALRKDKQTVRVVARPPRDECFVIDAFVQFAHHHPMFGGYSVEVAAGLTIAVTGYIFARAAGKREEMKLLSQSLETAIRELGSRDQPTIDRLLTTVDRMAEGLLPAVKRAVAPIGKSARKLTVGMASIERKVTIDEADRAAIDSPAGLTVDDERTYVVEISELDMQTGSCHAAIAPTRPPDDTRRRSPIPPSRSRTTLMCCRWPRRPRWRFAPRPRSERARLSAYSSATRQTDRAVSPILR